MLLTGSRVSRKDVSATCPEHILRRREEYSDKIQDDILTENILFHSASAAASFLMMVNVNGNLAWKTKEGHAWANIERSISCMAYTGSAEKVVRREYMQDNRVIACKPA